MKKLDKKFEKLKKRLRWYDISFIKLAVFFFTLFLVSLFPQFREAMGYVDWYWFLILTILCMIPPYKRILID